MKMTEEESIAYLRKLRGISTTCCEAIRTVCDALEAQRRAVPAAWLTKDGERCVTARTMDGARKDGGAILSSLSSFTVPLYAAAQAQPATPSALGPITGVWIDEQPATETAGDARDAERWRWLRENGKEMTYDALLEIIEEYGDRADAKLDAAILAAQGVKS